MDNYGYIKIAACCPELRPGDLEFNVERILELVEICSERGVRIAVFPELCITGYTCADLFADELLLRKSSECLYRIAHACRDVEMCIVVGAPLMDGIKLYNCGVVIQGGKIRGVVPKSHIPNYGEFYEKRWFASGKGIVDKEMEFRNDRLHNRFSCPFGPDLIFETNGLKFGIEICEDLWVPSPPSSGLCMAGADIILNLSATDELIGKHSYLKSLIKGQSARCRCAYAYASAGLGESSTDLAFSGNCIIAEDGKILAESNRFVMESKIVSADVDIAKLRRDRRYFNSFSDEVSEKDFRVIKLPDFDDSRPSASSLERKIDPTPFLEKNPVLLEERCAEISNIQAWGLAVRMRAIGCRKAVVGISGGLDSTLALLVTVKAFDMLDLDRKGITGITMPGFGTTSRTRSNAEKLMDILGVEAISIPIGEAVKQHFNDIGHDGRTPDVTYENSQARERTQILMDYANKVNAIVIGTGDLSELALGWCTYNGDHMSMYAVNSSIPKTLVRSLVEWYARHGSEELGKVLLDITDTPISPELLPADREGKIEQKTEDLVGPYELHDFFLYHMLRHGSEPGKILYLASIAFGGKYEDEEIRKWMRTFYKRFFQQQFKRSCMPDGVKVGSVSLSPRGDWRMPSDACVRTWLQQIDD